MIMMGDRKKTVNQILGPEKDLGGEGESPPDSLHACVEELVHAIHAKDIEGAKAALKACIADIHSEE